MKSKFSRRADWVEAAVIFERPTEKQPATPRSSQYLGISFSPAKQRWFTAIVGVVFFVIFARLISLQVVSGREYRVMAERNRQRIVPIRAERGHIFDRNGIQLTANVPNFSLGLVPQELPEGDLARRALVSRLAGMLNQNEAIIEALIAEYGAYSYESITIADDLDFDTALSLYIAAADLPGIEIQRGSKRLYEFASTTPSLAHLLGYEGKLDREEMVALHGQGYLPSDAIGKTGVEKMYENILRGVYGARRIEVNARGREQAALEELAPIPGSHLRLTIDLEMQRHLEKALRSHMRQANKTRGAAIVLDPEDGAVLALVSLPTFQNNDFSGGIDPVVYKQYISNPDQPLFNRAIAGTYPSGSTIKPALAAAALSEGIITPQTSLLSSGGIEVSQWFFPDWLQGGHGVTDVRKALAWSINTFFYAIGGGYGRIDGLGMVRIQDYLTRFGLGRRLGVDLPGEQPGLVPSPEWKEAVKGERWYIGDTYNISIGQGDLLVTPLQIASLTASIANGGTLHQPYLASHIIDPLTKQEKKQERTPLRERIVAPLHIETVRLGMKDCVTYGSCRRLSTLPFALGGKTGTAQWSAKYEPHAWFTSFAPWENPEITITVLIEEGGGGTSTALPVAEEFYRWWWGYRQKGSYPP